MKYTSSIKKGSIVGVMAAMALSLPLLAGAAFGAWGPFGGRVILELPCNNGLLLTLQEAYGITELMWNYGELPYLMYVPPHIGQYMIGMAGPTEVCTLGPYTIGSGNAIIYHGESL